MTDHDKANDYRKRLTESLKPVASIIEEAAKEGFSLTFNVTTKDGKTSVESIKVTKQIEL